MDQPMSSLSQQSLPPRSSRRYISGLLVLLAASMAPAFAQGPRAERILNATGVEGGIVVHLGCGDGELTASLRADERYTVHGLDADPDNVQAARERIRDLGLYGPVSIEGIAGEKLPYADGLINLVVVDDPGKVREREILRVLAPGGSAYIREDGTWRQVRKPRPDDIDEWTHFLHDAGNNAVARDEKVGPPKSVQWIAPPLFLRSHETPSGIEAVVTSAGRLFYFFDEGLIGITDQRLPEQWQLVCRDAFNGKLLWERPLDHWGWPEWARDRFSQAEWTEITGGRTVVPDENQRRLVADGDRVYATLGYYSPLSILDAATGEELHTIEGTEPVREIVSDDGIVVALSHDQGTPEERRRGAEPREGARLFGIDGATGDVLWQRDSTPVKALFLAIHDGRVVYQSGNQLVSLDLRTGEPQWQVAPREKNARTLVLNDGIVILRGGKALEARDIGTGRELWHTVAALPGGFENLDIFVVDGVVWPGMLCVDEQGDVQGKTAHVLAIGYDLKTGDEVKRVAVRDLRSPEHHHRCYRNKATGRYLISALEGAEFLDIQGDGHSQDNFVRGACKFGIMPANGLLYVPSDQCFCQPGAKLLGFAALSAEDGTEAPAVPDGQRLERGPAYGRVDADAEEQDADDWPTFRHDAARHAASATEIGEDVAPDWETNLGGKLTAPVAADGRVYVAAIDAHTLYALDADSGDIEWAYTAGGRIDSPPTICDDAVLFGSADGRVYCLQASDGELAWRFLAAPVDRRIGCFDQIESAWPVHGSVLLRDGVAYVTAGRSTYADGGVRLYGLDPESAAIMHTGRLEGPYRGPGPDRDVSFYILGANSDVLVSEGDRIYMRQKALTPRLEEIEPEVLSTKGEADVGLHVFSTSGLLDGSWYNRTFWMYSKRWPGFQLANQAPKSGQLLVVDDERTYGLKVFYRRNVHSLMFFPGREGYLLFADLNATEPQIVGEEGAVKPIEWLPQSGYARREGERTLDSEAFGLDKMIGYTRAEPPQWATWVPVRVRGMVKAGGILFAAGPPDEFNPEDPYAPFEGRRGARLVAVSADDGTILAENDLPAAPVFDGMIAADGRLFISREDGVVACLEG